MSCLCLQMHLGDRKSESYALQWQHIDFNNRQIILTQSQDRYGVIKIYVNAPDFVDSNVYDSFASVLEHAKAEV